MKKYFELFYRISFIAVSAIALAMHFDINDGNYNAHEFSFFTVQSNIFCFIIMSVILIKYFMKKDVCSQMLIFLKGMALSAILCTFLIYHFAEACGKYNFCEIGVFGIPTKDLFAHYLTPSMFILDWLLFQPKGYFKWSYILSWLIFPLSYFAGFMTRCYCNADASFANVQKFPYYFLDFETLGTLRFAHYIALIAVVLIAENTLIVMTDKLLSIRKSERIK